MSDIDPFGGKDILEVLKFYMTVFPDHPLFPVVYEEIKSLRELLAEEK